MSCGTTSPESATHVQSTTNTGDTPEWIYEATSSWMLALGIDSVRVVLKLRDSTQLTANAVYQTATVRPDDPEPWSSSLLSSNLTADGEACSGIVDVWAATRPAFYFRTGIAYKASGGGETGRGDVYHQASNQQCARLVGSKTIDVNIGTSGTYDEPVTDWLPANSAAIAKATVLMTNCSTYLQCQLIYQTATASPDSPGSWTTLGTAIQRTATNSEACTAEVAPSAGSVMWIRYGLRTSASSGSTAQGTISVAIAAKPV